MTLTQAEAVNAFKAGKRVVATHKLHGTKVELSKDLKPDDFYLTSAQFTYKVDETLTMAERVQILEQEVKELREKLQGLGGV